MDTRVRHQVGLKLGDIDVKSTIETQRSGKRRDDLRNETVQVGVGRTLDVEVTTADIVESLVVDLVGNIGMFQQGVDAKHRIIRFDDCSRSEG